MELLSGATADASLEQWLIMVADRRGAVREANCVAPPLTVLGLVHGFAPRLHRTLAA